MRQPPASYSSFAEGKFGHAAAISLAVNGAVVNGVAVKLA